MLPSHTRKTTCPRDCYDRCGIVATIADGRVIQVAGDPDSVVSRGSLCAKCTLAYNGVWLDPAARIATPLRRIGPKGGGQFAPATWDEALDDIATRLDQIAREHGSDTVLSTHFQGTYSAIACNFPSRFFHRYGATEVDPSTICDKAGHVALQAMFGTSFEGFDPRTAAQSACLVMWGINPSHSGPLTDRFWVGDFAGATIVVDPVRTPTAAMATLHLQLHPGTDAWLAYGLLKLLGEAGALDREFIQRHVRGWQPVQARIDACDLDRVADRTGVPVEQMRRAAHLIATGPTLFWMGIGLQRQHNGGDIVRAVSLLPAATGNLGRPGAGFLYMNGYGTRGIDQDALQRCGGVERPMPSISHMDLAAVLDDPARSRALFNWNTNIAASAPNQARLRQALRREDLLTVVIDLFHTDTAALADWILPAASFLEFDDLVLSYFYETVSAQVRLQAPFGESLPNQEIFRRLARRMGFADADLHETDAAIIDRLLAATGAGLSFQELAQVGTVFTAPEPRIQFEHLRFPTPSGRIEIDAAAFIDAGLGPAPDATSPDEPDSTLRLLTPSAYWLMNSSYGNDARIREQLGPASILLNPEDADDLGILPGEIVTASTDTGSLELEAVTTNDVPRGTAVAYKSRWPGLEASGQNINALNPGLRADLGAGTAVNSLRVRIALAGD